MLKLEQFVENRLVITKHNILIKHSKIHKSNKNISPCKSSILLVQMPLILLSIVYAFMITTDTHIYLFSTYLLFLGFQSGELSCWGILVWYGGLPQLVNGGTFSTNSRCSQINILYEITILPFSVGLQWSQGLFLKFLHTHKKKSNKWY